VTLEAIKRKAVGKALLRANGKIARAARELGISRQAIYEMAKRYGWLDAEGKIDPNLVADARRCREYWQPSELRDTPSKQAEKRKRMGQVNREKMPVDMGAIRCGDSNRMGGY
jgi:hypothetical protein